MEKFAQLREAIERVELVDAHAHNIVALDSGVPFLSCFSEATGDEALSHVPHTINFKVRFSSQISLYPIKIHSFICTLNPIAFLF